MVLNERQQKVWEFAKLKHGDQKRKYTFQPYTNHLWAVAELVDGVGLHETVVCGALLHDILEDTDCTELELYNKLKEVGYNYWTQIIVNRVKDCTDLYTSEKYPNLNRASRKEQEAIRLSNIAPASQSIKYADFIDNISSIAEYDPGFAETYIQEKIRILDGMRQGHVKLLIGACAALSEAEKTIRNSRRAGLGEYT